MMCFSLKGPTESESGKKANHSFGSILNSLVDGESFYGYIKDKSDAVLVIEACRREYLPFVRERLNDFQRESIRCGSVYVFHEEESKIKRWTDGMVWTPSRNLLGFIHYREIWKNASQKYRKLKSATTLAGAESACFHEEINGNTLEGLYKPGGFFKKCISYELSDGIYHLISYACIVEGLYPQGRIPSSIPAFQRMKAVPVSLGMRQIFSAKESQEARERHERERVIHERDERSQNQHQIHPTHSTSTIDQRQNVQFHQHHHKENASNNSLQKVPSELDKLAMAIAATSNEKKENNRFGILQLSRIK